MLNKVLGALVALSLFASVAYAQTSTGNYGTDYSVNRPALTALNLLTTIPALPTPGQFRRFEADCNCTAGMFVVLDDGTDTGTNCTAGKCTIVPIAGGASNGVQGGTYTNEIHTGRVRIYSSSATCQVAVRSYP